MSADAARIAADTLAWAQEHRPELVPELLRVILAGSMRAEVAKVPDPIGAPAPRPKFEELYRKWWHDHGRTKTSHKADRSRSRAVLSFFGELTDEEIQPGKVREFEDRRLTQRTRYGRPPRPASINREIMLIRAVLNWGAKQDPPLCKNKLRRLAMADEDNIKAGRVTDTIMWKLRPHMNEVIWALCLILYDSGMREMEGCLLKWSQFDHETGRTRLLRSQVKGKKMARLPRLTPRAIEAAMALPRECDYVFGNPETGEAYHPRYLYALLEKACAAAGVTDTDGQKITFHTFRHSFAYRARVEWGWSERTIMAVMGHKTRSAAERYGIVDDEEVDAAFDARDRLMADERKGPRRAESSTGDVRKRTVAGG